MKNKILGAILLLITLTAGFYIGVNYIKPRVGGMVHNVREIFSAGLELKDDLVFENNETIDGATDEMITFSGGLVFDTDVAEASRTRGTYIKIDDRDIGLTTPADVTGAKLDFIYATEPTVSGAGKNVVGVDIWMRMDYDYDFGSADRNADVRAARIQTELRGSLGGMLEGIYANAKTNIAANETIVGEHTTGAYGVGMTALQARTEVSGAGTLTVPHIAGVYILHRTLGAGGVTGDYHGIHIENPQEVGAISGTKTGFHFEPNTMSPPGGNFDYGIDMNAVSFDTADVRFSGGGRIITGTSVPSTCSSGDIFIDSDAGNDPAAVLFICDADEDGDGEYDPVTVTD